LVLHTGAGYLYLTCLEKAHIQHRYTYSITMAALIIQSANLLTYWTSQVSYQVVAIILFILIIFAINSRGVKVSISVTYWPSFLLVAETMSLGLWLG
jgi:amino acid permease